MTMSGPGEPRDDKKENEEDLVRLLVAYQAGELAAFERLYAALVDDVSRYLAAAARQGDVLQDLVQETFMEIHRSRRTYQPPLPVRPWVFGIARNVLGRHRRRMWRRARHEDRGIQPADEQMWSTAPPARSLAVEPRDIEDALRRLPAGRRDAWLLHHVHGFSFQQIAERFRIGVGAAKLRSSRAMKTLRTTLGIEPGGRDD
jgi:RNA polymerase sigma-70 factor (ECF subfamily)